MAIEYIDKRHAKLVYSKGTGKHRIRRSKRIEYTGKRDAERQYRDFCIEVERETGIDRSMTIEGLLNWYISDFELNGGKITTIRAYRTASKPIISFLGGYCAKDVNLVDIDRFIASETKIRSSKTIRNELSLLKSSYTFAIKRGLLKDNPCMYASAPRQIKPKVNILSESEVDDFYKALDNTVIDFKVMCELALFCGLRKSEIYGLMKCDITDKIRIERVRHHIKGKSFIETTKTTTSNRILVIPPFILDDISKMIESQKSRPDSSDFLILNGWGEPPSSYWCDKHMHQLIEDNDLPRVTMHGLRHTYASMLVNAGVPIADVSQQLGHSSVDTTLRIYTHVFKDATEASDRISQMINAKMTPKRHHGI